MNNRVDPNVTNKKVLEPFYYMIDEPGKKFRSKLGVAFNFWLQIPDDKLEAINEIIETCHNGSLIMDDIQDNSIIRRGKPASHCVYGVASCMNSLGYVFFNLLKKFIDLNVPEAAPMCLQAAAETLRCQTMEICWRNNVVCPTEEEYCEMVLGKTGSLFKQIMQTMQLFSKDKRDYSRLTEIFGLFFQIRNDYINLSSDEYMSNKSFCEDITEGKFGFPVVHAINSHPEDHELLNILRQSPTDIKVKKHFLSILKKYGSLDYTEKYLDELKKEAEEILSKLDENPLIREVLEAVYNMEI